MLNDYQDVYIYDIRLADGKRLVQVAYKCGGQEFAEDMTPEAAAQMGLGRNVVMPYICVTELAETIDSLIDELQEN